MLAPASSRMKHSRKSTQVCWFESIVTRFAFAAESFYKPLRLSVDGLSKPWFISIV